MSINFFNITYTSILFVLKQPKLLRKFQAMMRRQRLVNSLPSQDDSSFFLDFDNMSILSSQFSYPETIWPQVISPEPETLVPYYVYPYPFLQISAEPVSFIPTFPDSCLIPDPFSAFGDFYPNYNELTENIINVEPFCNSPYGDGNITENLPPSIDVPANENNNIPFEELKTFPTVTSYGAVAILLRHLVRVDISPSKAVYVTNLPASCIAAVNGVGDKSCVIHPNGRVHHIGQDVHMITLDRQAKICRRGIIFTSNAHCLTYIVDDSGTKTTSEKLRKLNHDFSLRVFYSDDMSERNLEECYKLVDDATYKSYKNGDEVWIIGGLRIKQDQRGDVRITRNGDCYTIRTSPTTGEVSIKTFSTEINIGRYADNYFAVRKGEKRVSASLKLFNVQNGSQKAGFNNCGKVVLF